jgi:hypothetical protein
MSTRTSQLKEAIPSPPRVWTNVNVIIIYINWGNSQLLHYSYYPIFFKKKKNLRTNFFIKSFLGFFTYSTKRTEYFTVCMSCPALFFFLFFSNFVFHFFIESFKKKIYFILQYYIDLDLIFII